MADVKEPGELGHASEQSLADVRAAARLLLPSFRFEPVLDELQNLRGHGLASAPLHAQGSEPC